MITDDDPLENNFLEVLNDLQEKYPNHSIYAGFNRKNKKNDEIELIEPNDFLLELLDPQKTINFLWSSCMILRSDLLHIGKLPDYNSPHLFDHAMIAMVGSEKGAVIINRMFGYYLFHDNNFSKSNFEAYYLGCKGFYKTLNSFCISKSFALYGHKIIKKHVYFWFINNIFSLKKYYYINRQKYPTQYSEVNLIAKKILSLNFMSGIIFYYHIKNFIFQLKKISFNLNN
jgi:hypothetical protein